MQRILLIGDSSGRPDEGMKRIAQELGDLLGSNNGMAVARASVSEVLRNPGAFGKIDLVHYMAGPSWRSFLYASLLRRFLGCNPKTIIFFIHPTWSRLASMCLRAFKPDAAIVQSEKWARYCSRFDIVVSDELQAGVDLKKFRQVSEEQRRRIRDRIGLPADKKILLHIGHLNVRRNVLALAEFTNDADILPVVVGSTTVRASGRIVSALQRAGAKVIREYLENVEEFYQAADCYVFPTVDPHGCVQIPLSVLEALACGVPVVTTRFEGLPHYLPEGFPGLTYVDNPAAIRQGVQRVLCSGVRPDPAKLQKFSWDSIARNTGDLYRRILAT